MKEQFEYGGECYTYEIIKSRRKSVMIQVTAEKGIVVRMPEWYSVRKVYQFVEEKRAWIVQQQKQLEKKMELLPRKQYSNGETFFVQGVPHVLMILKDSTRKRATVECVNQTLWVRCAEEKEEIIQPALLAWYKKQAKDIIGIRAKKYAQIMHETFGEIHIRDQKSRWGSCSASRNLNFNWRLILAPVEVMDYVIIHELCHLEHMNHSQQFWRHVEEYMPDYRNKKKWLKDHGNELIV